MVTVMRRTSSENELFEILKLMVNPLRSAVFIVARWRALHFHRSVILCLGLLKKNTDVLLDEGDLPEWESFWHYPGHCYAIVKYLPIASYIYIYIVNATYGRFFPNIS